MDEIKYPIGVQTFSKIIEGKYVYVDKTSFVAKLTANGGYYFLSRPRRFGKSLLLSTLEAYFEGRRELFKGLAIDTMDVDWTPCPVIHIDLNSEVFTEGNGLSHLLDRTISKYERLYNISDAPATLAGRFGSLLEEIYRQTGQKVAILVDEYDKPLLGIEHDPELFAKNQALLKGFFGNLKSMDPYIRFAFLTGGARFNKVSIFSDLNNLYDISLDDEYADICGWTEDELLSNFRPGIERLAHIRNEEYSLTLKMLRTYYDGYLFAPKGHRLYNPYSILTALRKGCIQPFWYETATPTFLTNRVKRSGIALPDLNSQYADRIDLLKSDNDSGNPLGLMFQTGYLTIADYMPEMDLFTLRFPNREVEIGFARELAPLYVDGADNPASPFALMKFKMDLMTGKPEEFMRRMRTLIKNLPYEMQNENNYQSIVWLLCMLCSAAVTAENHSYRGRSDLEVITPGYIYVFEFKYNRSPEEAIEQLYCLDYGGRHGLDTRPTYCIGANFSTKPDTRGLTGWIIKPLK